MKRLILGFGLLLLGATGCKTTSRFVTAQHWHDAETVFIGYTERTQSQFLGLSLSDESSAHVLRCRVQADNSAQCGPQPSVDGVLAPK
ncbi:MAG: hypothetical protein HYV07_08580 [Deltaproteobacteria bacterium]|nr:hypothetical protein [Deltaproteobacteria bacterium]